MDSEIDKIRDFYTKIGSIPCPAFNNDKVYFTDTGFKHLIEKNRKLRTKDDRNRRFILIKHVPQMLGKAKSFSTYRKSEIGGSVAHFWSIEKNPVVIIIRQIGKGNKHFFSVFSKKHTDLRRGL